MKHYVDIKHVSTDIPKVFEEKIKKAALSFQNEGYSVEIQQGFNGKVFSALVMAYLNKQHGDRILNNLED